MNNALVDLVADIIGVDTSEVLPTTSRENAEQWDSMNHLRLITALEESFSIRLTMDEIENIMNFEDLEAAVARHT